MKKIKYLALVIAATLVSGCEHLFDEYNTDPNSIEMWQS